MRLAFLGAPRCDPLADALRALGHDVAFGGDDDRDVTILWDLGGAPEVPLDAPDLVLAAAGGEEAVRRYEEQGARRCAPFYAALDPVEHRPAPPRDDLRADLALVVDRRPQVEARAEEFFFRAVELLPERTFLLGGTGWDDRVGGIANLRYVGALSAGERNAVDCSALAVLNVTGEDVVAGGWAPTPRLFEAAGAGACLISDTWRGIEDFLHPCREVQLARNGQDVADLLSTLPTDEARRAGDAARTRVLDAHTYAHRARQLDALLT